jgi:hypothetical protein
VGRSLLCYLPADFIENKVYFWAKKGYVENYPYFGRNSIFLEKPHKKEIIHQWLAPNFECKSTEAIL